MIKSFEVKKKDGTLEMAKVILLDDSHIESIMEIQQEVYNGLDNKELYSPSNEDEFLDYIKREGIILGVTNSSDELIAMGVFIMNGMDSHNYGYDIGISGEELLKVGQIESTIVKPEYRGNSLQLKICEILEELGKEKGTEIMTATASPLNSFSVNTFKKLGYEIVLEKIKYGGLRRYVMKKEF
ncbi:MAG: GNAT family N-acetyltransferase [Clostridium sp.]